MKEGYGDAQVQFEELIKSGTAKLPEGYSIPPHAGHQESFTTERSATHRGKEVLVETTYRILIDGVAAKVHTSVGADGKVHCHFFPNYSFESALDLAKLLVEASLRERPENELTVPMDHMGGH